MIEQRGTMAAHPICVALASQVRKAAFKAVKYSGNDEFRGARIHLCDLADLEIRACEVSGLKIIHCWATMAVVRGTTTSRSVSAVQRPARGRGSLREIDRYGGKYGSLLGAENKRRSPVGSCEPQALRWAPRRRPMWATRHPSHQRLSGPD